MTSRLRTFLIAAAILFAATSIRPSARAQGFGGMFSSFKLNGVSGDEMEASTVITAGSADIDLANNVIVLIGNVVVDDKSSRITCNRMEIYLDEDAADALVGTADKPEDAAPAPDRKQEKADRTDAEKSGEAAEDEEDGEEEEERKNIRRIDCVGDVVFRKRANPNDPNDNADDQIAMADKADYDVVKEVIVMTGAHSAPEKVILADLFDVMMSQIRSNNIARCPVMMQGENWMVGETFTIFLKEDNRLKVKDMKFNYIGDSLLPDDEKDEKDGKDDKVDKDASGGKKTSALIAANDADIYIEHNIITLTGNVDVDQESDQPVRMTCDKMEIVLVDDVPASSGADETGAPAEAGKDKEDFGKKASEIHCTGDFVYRKRVGQDASGGEDQIAMSDRADYDAEKEILVLTGKPVMMQGANKVHGSRIEIYPKEDNRMAIEGMKAYYTGKALLSSSGDRNGADATTVITAEIADVRPDEAITLSRNVLVDDGSAQIACGKMQIFMRKDASSSLFNFNGPAAPDDAKPDADADKQDENELGNDISRIVCTGDVVYRKISETGGRDQIVLSRQADYDADQETIFMSGAHSNPKAVISAETYEEIVHVLGKGKPAGAATPAAGPFDPYSILMQGDNWIAGNPITIRPQEGNRLTATDMKAALRRSSRSKSGQEGKQ